MHEMSKPFFMGKTRKKFSKCCLLKFLVCSVKLFSYCFFLIVCCFSLLLLFFFFFWLEKQDWIFLLQRHLVQNYQAIFGHCKLVKHQI